MIGYDGTKRLQVKHRTADAYSMKSARPSFNDITPKVLQVLLYRSTNQTQGYSPARPTHP